MKKSDLFLMALQNLKNRKTRTRLTVIGVVIGTFAIVIMVSIGIGIDKMITSQYQSDSSLNKIEVHGVNPDYFENESYMLSFDDKAVEYFQSLDHVQMVVPELSLYSDNVRISRGKYSTQWSTVKGIDLNAMEMLGFKLTEGSFANTDKYTVFFGERTVTNFTDSQGNQAKYKLDEDYNVVESEINPMTDTFFMNLYVYNENTGESKNMSSQKVRVGGVLKYDYNVDYETYDGIFMDIDTAKEMWTQCYSGSSNTKFEYSGIEVFVDSMDNVSAVQENIQEAGFYCYSSEEEMDYIKKVMLVVQLVLGAIGAVSMFVAAFGISNTMVMSVYERTKEIGIMKVLGCDLKDIKMLFLYEAGAIGFFGGIIGMVVSYVVSLTANVIAKIVVEAMGGAGDLTVCVSSIPPWLCIAGILFSVLVGVIAGLSPAKRSVNVSALTAIHNE